MLGKDINWNIFSKNKIYYKEVSWLLSGGRGKLSLYNCVKTANQNKGSG